MPQQGKNIYKRKDGRWEGRYAKNTEAGKTHYGYVYGKTYNETAEKLSFVTTSADNESPYKNITFSDIAAEWIKLQAAQLKESSASKYRNILSIYLVPKFGNCVAHTIRRSEIIAYSSFLLTHGKKGQTGLAPKTVNSILSVMKSILKYAARELYIPIADLSNGSVRQPQKTMRVLSSPEQQRLSKYLLEQLSPCNLGILICLYTGLRIGEICALKWKNVSFEEGYIFVQESMQRIQVQAEKHKTAIFILPPKSACSIRRIPLPAELIRILEGERKGKNAFVLTGEENRFVEPRCMENRFNAIAAECKIDSVTFHSLRHTFATRCVELGFDIKSLSEILGHASVNITLNRYVHPSMELKQKNMNMLSTFLTII